MWSQSDDGVDKKSFNDIESNFYCPRKTCRKRVSPSLNFFRYAMMVSGGVLKRRCQDLKSRCGVTLRTSFDLPDDKILEPARSGFGPLNNLIRPDPVQICLTRIKI